MLTVKNQGGFGAEHSELRFEDMGAELEIAVFSDFDEANVILEPRTVLELSRRLAAWAIENGANESDVFAGEL